MQHSSEDSSTEKLIEALDALRGKKHFMVLMAKFGDVCAALGLFRLEGLSAAEIEQLANCPSYRHGKEFPWELFCRAIDFPRALPIIMWLLYGLPLVACSAGKYEYVSSLWPLDQLPKIANNQVRVVYSLPLDRAYWGDDASWLAFLRLGSACRWGVDAVLKALRAAGPDSGLSPRMRILTTKLRINAEANPSVAAVEKNTYGLLDPLLAEAVISDSPSRVLITKSMCSHSPQELFHFITAKSLSAQVLCHWLRTFPESDFHATRLDVLVFIVATWPYEIAKPVVMAIEELRPGSTRDYLDSDGRNLLWYVRKNSYCGTLRFLPREGAYNLEMFKFLIGTIGLSPFQVDKHGYTFADFDAVAAACGNRQQDIGLTAGAPTFDNSAFWGEKGYGAKKNPK